MNVKTTSLAALLAATFAAGFAAPADAAERWEFDRPHSQVLFTVNHLGFTDLTGQFREFSGELHLDTEDLTRSSVQVSIDTASVDMNYERLDAHLRNPDFFDVDTHPAMTFRSTSVERVGEGRYTLNGELTIIGQTRPVALDLAVNNIGPHPMRGTPWAGFTATGSIKRSDFGMTYAVPAVGDEIAIRINVEARPASE